MTPPLPPAPPQEHSVDCRPLSSPTSTLGTTAPRVLVAGIGNVFLGDDAFGVEVAQRLGARTVPVGVEVRDFGIRGFDLAFALLEEYDLAILVDAVPGGGEAGSLSVIEVDTSPGELPVGALQTHSIDPVCVLQLVAALGGQPRKVLVVGCKPLSFGPENEGHMGLSGPVESAIEPAIALVHKLIARAALAAA